MAQNFLSARNLPPTGITRQAVYDLMEQINPLAALLDARILQVIANQIAPANGLPFWRKNTVTYSQLATGALTNDIELFSLEAGGVIHAVKLKHSAAFTGGAISAYTVKVGVTGWLDKYMPPFSVFAAPTNTNCRYRNVPSPTTPTLGNTDNEIGGLAIGAAYSQAEVQALRSASEELADDVRNINNSSIYGILVSDAEDIGHENHGAVTSIRIAATSTGANLNAATAGSVDVWTLRSVVL